MGLFNTFRNWEHKYALTFMGVILAFLFGGFSVYVYLQKTAPNLRVEEISNANVIDVREDVGKLDILFNGANLRDKHQTLALVTLRVMNDGAAPISKGAYDDVDPIGLEVNGGDITKAELFNASSTNIAKSMKVFVLTNSMVTFAPVILEAGDFFWIKLLILHSEKGNFDVKPIGKIAGVKQIAFINLNTKEALPSLWRQVFAGGVWTQAGRLLAYFGGPLILLFLVIGIGAGMSSAKAKAREISAKNTRTAHVIAFKTHSLTANASHSPKYDWVLNYYINSGSPILRSLQASMEQPKDSQSPGWMKQTLDAQIIMKSHNQEVSDPLFRNFVLDFAAFIESKSLDSLGM